MSANRPDHSTEHREQLEAILTAEDVERAFRESELASCEVCRAELAWHRSLVDGVRALGAEEAAELTQARAERGAPGEERVAEVLGREMAGAAGPRALAGSRRLRWWSAAAVLLVAIGATIWWPGERDPLEPGPRIIMGDDVQLVAPLAEFDADVRFVWKTKETRIGWFELKIWDAASGDVVFDERVREGTSWRPTPAEYEQLPREIRWQVIVIDPSGGVGPVSHEARARRSSD